MSSQVTPPAGYRSDVLVRWGDPVTRRAPAFDVHNQTPEAAAESLERDAFALAIVSKSPFGRDFGKRLARIVEKVGGDRVVVVCGEDFEEVARISAARGARACLTTPFEVVFIPDILDELSAVDEGGNTVRKEDAEAGEGDASPGKDDL